MWGKHLGYFSGNLEPVRISFSIYKFLSKGFTKRIMFVYRGMDEHIVSVMPDSGITPKEST